ncbi:helix-turn-helix domain-containing protein [Methanothermococcus okinawensis]|uniref:Resolvase helix-turn-helix domain protein n=1 Tax=Methanothermococcus okinawensis (strain DSM 14208 / JCM 11175 / IH1) TaxID=647113 RepID=F8ANS8_METOI|nr:helix-turn-helix domain-containing protein [Methanothermococcus okinawensis]AEH06277.1 Resolvase helix-turn-helix domain protein [Methanothermococcus okinawensis IH1]
MIELKFSHFLRWDEINKLVEKAKNNMVIVKLPLSIYNNPKMTYKIEFMRKNHIIVESENNKRGRKEKLNENIKQEILELYREGYSINKIANMLKLPKSTIFTNVKDDINKIKIEMKKEELTSLVYEYKEYLIKNDLYHPYIESQFMELKVYVDNNDLETAYNKLKEIIEYIKSQK